MPQARWMRCDNCVVSLQQVADQAVASVQRARSLLSALPAPATASGAALESAAQITTETGQRAATLSGALADRHQAFVNTAAATVSDYGRTDTILEQHLRTTALVTQAGALRLDGILDQTKTIANAAGTAQTPAEQRAMLTGLRSRVTQANSVVNTAQQQADVIANQIRGLDYRTRGRTNAPGHDGSQMLGGPKPRKPPHLDPDKCDPELQKNLEDAKDMADLLEKLEENQEKINNLNAHPPPPGTPLNSKEASDYNTKIIEANMELGGILHDLGKYGCELVNN